jgi:hypothetical protein
MPYGKMRFALRNDVRPHIALPLCLPVDNGTLKVDSQTLPVDN